MKVLIFFFLNDPNLLGSPQKRMHL